MKKNTIENGKKMKSTLINYARMICLAGVLAAPLTSPALNIEIGDAYYLGVIKENPPLNPNNEVGYINSFAALPAGNPDALATVDNTMAILNRGHSTFAGPFPTAVTDDFNKRAVNMNQNVAIDTTGYSYVLAQYSLGTRDSRALVWLLPDNTQSVTLSGAFDGQRGSALVHVSLYKSTGADNVPDGGTTLLLLGSVLAGFAIMRRKLA